MCTIWMHSHRDIRSLAGMHEIAVHCAEGVVREGHFKWWDTHKVADSAYPEEKLVPGFKCAPHPLCHAHCIYVSPSLWTSVGLAQTHLCPDSCSSGCKSA